MKTQLPDFWKVLVIFLLFKISIGKQYLKKEMAYLYRSLKTPMIQNLLKYI